MGMGYQGYMKLGTNVVLVTGGGINLVLEPIYSNAAWGAGWKNAAPSAHYADSVLRYEGTLDFELQLGAVWTFLVDWIVTNRITAKTVVISPDGAKVFTYTAGGGVTGAWNTSAGFSTSEGSFVTLSAGVMAFSRAITDGDSYIDNNEGAIAGNCTVFSPTNPLNLGGLNMNPIPFWKTTAEILVGGNPPQADLMAVEWSVDATQNTIVVYTCKKTRTPRAILQGSMDVSGSVVMYHPDGVFDPIADTTMGGYNSEFVVDINAGAATIRVPAIVLENDDYSIPGQDTVTNKTFSFKGMGGYCDGGNATSPLLLT